MAFAWKGSVCVHVCVYMCVYIYVCVRVRMGLPSKLMV